jgi:hypothetical protein
MIARGAQIARLVRLLGLIALVGLCTVTPAIAEPRRFALLVGAATGEGSEPRLQFAEADAERIAAVLRDVGGFGAEDVVVLNTVSAGELRRALIALNARVREVQGDSLLFVFYSGHADAEALQLAGTRLSTIELRDLVYGSPATVRVLVIDACRSGAVTRIKGGRRGPAFAIDLDERLRSKGVAILTSSAEAEDSQESDELRASFFTHYLASALRGAADSDADHRVTLVEAFTYASEHTLTATARTLAGPQHPTYRFDLTGREDVVLTRPIADGQRIGTLLFSERGAYVVQQRDAVGSPVAEVEVGESARWLALPEAPYFVTQRAADHLLQGRFTVSAARTTAVRAADMERIAYAHVVRKGGTALARSASVFAAGGLKTGLREVGPGLGIEGGLRLDLPAWSLELRLGGASFGPSGPDDQKRDRSAHELDAAVAGLRATDLRHATLAAGIVAGGFRLTRELGAAALAGRPAEQIGAMVGAVAQLHRQLVGRVYARLEVGALGYVASAPSGAPLETTVVWSLNLGIGAFL